MRREELFNRDGVYSAIVHHNLLMHREATDMGAGILKTLFEGRPKSKPVKVLDLACGGLPISIAAMVAQINDLLDESGIFLNHDWYRPDRKAYVRRPSCNPRDKDESYRLVHPTKLATDTRPYDKTAMDFGTTTAQWRLTFINGLTDSYRDQTNDDKGADTLKSHMLERDFPVSRKDLADIMTAHGFRYKIFDYHDSGQTIWPFMAMPIACKNQSVYSKAVSTAGRWPG